MLLMLTSGILERIIEIKQEVRGMLDIFEDSTGNLELERFKCKLQEIWMRILSETYTEEDGSKEEFMEANALRFANDPHQETETDNLMAMLEDLLNPQEALESVKSDAKAPTYNGKQLSANNEKGKIEATKYEVKHTSTKTPGDSKSSVKSSTYDAPSNGKIATRKDARVIRSFGPMAEMMKDELTALKKRQAIGRREMLFRL
jgi:hypothetical protein